MTKIFAITIMQLLVLRQDPISIEKTLEFLKQSEAIPQRMYKLPGDTRLDMMYNDVCDKINEINSSDSSTADKFMAVKQYRDGIVPSTDLEYVVKTCQTAFNSRPVDWETVRRCFVVAQIGMRDERLGAVAASVVSFDGLETTNVGVDQIRTTMAALTTIARFNLPDSTDIVRRCANGSMWKEKSITSSARPDLVRLIQSRAILCLSALPVDTAEPIIAELEQIYPRSMVADGGEGGRLALFVALAKEDLEQQRKGEPPIIFGIH